jgi:splicing factor 3B subunit 3
MPDDKGILFVNAATHVQKNLFFFLVQSEYGDIYKITLAYEEEDDEIVCTDIMVKYFDTVPPATSMCVLKTGFLFAASEFGNHYLFQFQGIGERNSYLFTFLYSLRMQIRVFFSLTPIQSVLTNFAWCGR